MNNFISVNWLQLTEIKFLEKMQQKLDASKQVGYNDSERGNLPNGDSEIMATKKASDVSVVHSKDTKQILIPDGMPLLEASQWLIDKNQAEDKKVGIHHEIDCFPLDGAVAFREALDEVYGFSQNVDTPGDFPWDPANPPTVIGVPTGPDTVKQIPWGRVQIPGIAGFLETSLSVKPTPRFILAGETKQRHLPDVERIVAAMKSRLKAASIYKGKAFRLDLSWLREGRSMHPVADAPKFTVPIDANPEELIFPKAVKRDVELGLFTPIEKSELCRQHKIPLKRGILLEGPFGVGKTLTAYVTARKAVENGWTFIYLANVMDLSACFKIAAQYAPCVIFAEDVDRVIGGDQRTEAIDAVLNSFDGIEAKNTEIITVLTTNHVEKLSQAILRPGRCDTLVSVTRPDAEAAAKLVTLYGRGLISKDADMKVIGTKLNGRIPAEIREAVERAKLAAIDRLNGPIEGNVMQDDIVEAVHAMEAQHLLLKPKDVDKRGVAEKCADIIGTHISESMAGSAASVAIRLLQQLGMEQSDIYAAADALSEDDDLES